MGDNAEATPGYTRMQDDESVLQANPGDSASQFNLSNANVQVLSAGNATSGMSGLDRVRGSVKLLKILSVLSAVCAVLMFFLGFGCFISNMNNRHSYRFSTCHVGYSGWASILFVVCSVFGVFATFRMPKSRCLLTTFFVLSIISALFCAAAVFLSTGYVIDTSGRRVYEYGQYYTYPSDDTQKPNPDYNKQLNAKRTSIVFNSLLLVFSLLEFASLVVSASLICVYWNRTGSGCCGGSGNGPTVLYIAPNNTQGQPQIVVLPAKMHRSKTPVTIQLNAASSSAPLNANTGTEAPPLYKDLQHTLEA